MKKKFNTLIYLIGPEKERKEFVEELEKANLDYEDCPELRFEISKMINQRDVKVLIKGDYVHNYNALIKDYKLLKETNRLDLMGNDFFLFLHKTLDGYFSDVNEIVDDYYNKYDYFYENLLKKKLSIPKHKVELIKFCEYAQIYGYKEKNVGKNK